MFFPRPLGEQPPWTTLTLNFIPLVEPSKPNWLRSNAGAQANWDEKPTIGPLIPFPPAATITMLPVVSVLQTVAVVVLPRTATPLTLVGPRFVTEDRPTPATLPSLLGLGILAFLKGTLLSIYKGLRALPNEVAL